VPAKWCTPGAHGSQLDLRVACLERGNLAVDRLPDFGFVGVAVCAMGVTPSLASGTQ